MRKILLILAMTTLSACATTPQKKASGISAIGGTVTPGIGTVETTHTNGKTNVAVTLH